MPTLDSHGAAVELAPPPAAPAAEVVEGYWANSGLFGWSGVYYLEVLVAWMVAVVALLALFGRPRARLGAAGELTAVGALLALHLLGLLVQIAKWEGVDAIRFGGPLGSLGGLLLVTAAAGVVRAEPQPDKAPAATGVPAT